MNKEPAKTDTKKTKSSKKDDALAARVAALETTLQEQEEKILRLHADLQNKDRRIAEEKSMWNTMVYKGLLGNIAPVLHELQMLHDNTEDTTAQGCVVKLFQSLEKTGLTPLAPEAGEKIDPEKHEVLMIAEGESGTIVALLEKGWQHNNTVLIPAKVSAAV